MSNRSDVLIEVLKSQASHALLILQSYDHFDEVDLNDLTEIKEGDNHSYLNLSGDLIAIKLHQVNFAYVDEESEDLIKAGIAHNISWSEGGDYNAGRKFRRFLKDGTVSSNETEYLDTIMINAEMVRKCLQEEGLEATNHLLTKHLAENSEPSWDQQIEYGKVYSKNIEV